MNNLKHDSWGYFTANCTGQRTDPNSAFNLEREEFGQTWEENLYDLVSNGAGYCYTYNPPEISGIRFEDRLFMLLGNRLLQREIGQNLRGFGDEIGSLLAKAKPYL